MKDSIIVDGVEYRPIQKDGGLSIVIVDNRGLTFVGYVTPSGDGFTIRDARCVIRWGTSEHLAELAANGPFPNTTLGHKRDVWVQQIVLRYSCSESWDD